MHTGGENRIWNQLFLHISHLHDVDLALGHTAYHCVSIINIYLHTKYHSNHKTFCGW